MTQRMIVGYIATMYIARVGTAGAEEISRVMDLPLPFLRKVLVDLVSGYVLAAKKGPGGGYSLIGDVTLSDVFAVLQPLDFLTQNEFMDFRVSGDLERRSLVQLALGMQAVLDTILNKPLTKLVFDLKQTEVLNKANVEGNPEYH